MFEILFVLILTLALSAALVGLLDRRAPGPASGLLFFFAVLFLATWTLGVWIGPIPFARWGGGWLTYTVVSMLILLLIVTIIPSGGTLKASTDEGKEAAKEEAKATAVAAGLWFWSLVILLLASILVSYTIDDTPPFAPFWVRTEVQTEVE